MASLMLIGGLAGAGYMLNKDGKQPRGEVQSRQELAKEDTPNGDNVYKSKQYEQNRHEERKIMHDRYKQSRDPINTGMIPPIFNSLGVNECCDYSPVETQEGGLLPDATRQHQEKKVTRDQNKIFSGPMFTGMGGDLASNSFSELSETGSAGTAIDSSGGWENVTQQVSGLTGRPMDTSHNNQVPFFSGNNPILRDSALQIENFTGTGGHDRPKRELEQDSMFAPVSENIYGTPNMPDELRKERFIQSNLKTNVLPFPQTRVASGLNQEGFGSTGADGFHSMFRPHIRNVDELRPLSDPKMQYEGRVIVGKRDSALRRGQIGQVSKNQPDRFYVNEPARWGRGRAANYEMKMDEDYATALKCTDDGFEIGELHGIAATHVSEARPGMEKADYEGLPMQEGFNGASGVNSLHRATYKTSHKNQFQRNVGATVKDMNNDNVRMNYLPGIMEEERATTEPQTERNQTNVRGAVGEGQMQFFDEAQQTIADTLPHDDRKGNLKGNRSDGMGYEAADYEADFQPTNKQFTSMRGYSGVANRSEQGQGYEREFIDGARTTTRETVLGALNYAGVAKTDAGEPMSYATYFASQRDRKYVNNPDYKGAAGTAQSNRLVNRENYNNAIIRSRQERLLHKRAPTQEKSKNVNVGSQDITIQSRRQVSTIPNQYALSGGAGGNGAGVKPMAPTGEMHNLTQHRKNPPGNIEWQLDPAILDQFRANPYSQSLHSY